MNKEKVKDLNDNFRNSFVGGRVVMTSSVSALPDEDISRIIGIVSQFDEFTEENDPYGEHDFGAFTYKGKRYYWKIDYYDNSLSYHSPDKSDASVTVRVLTIMSAMEY